MNCRELQGGNLGLDELEEATDLLSDCLQTSVNPKVNHPDSKSFRLCGLLHSCFYTGPGSTAQLSLLC